MRKFIPYLLSKWTFILFLISVQSLELNAQSMGIFESYSILDINGGGNTYYDCQASTANPDFNGNYFGTLNSSNTLVVKGGETKIYKCGACNVTGTRVYYRVWLTSAGASGSFNQLDTWWDSQVGNSCGSVNQKWLCNNGTTDILSTLSQSGNYTLEIYFAGTGNGCSEPSPFYSNNSGANFKATFDYCKTSGPLNGTYKIPGCYATIQNAVTALNTNGVSGSVVFNVAAGHTETAMAQISMTATGTSSNPITFQKSGAGTNPKITVGWTGVSNTAAIAAPEGIWSFAGSDYITIDGIDIADLTTNNTDTKLMKFGYGFFKGGVNDGASYNTIKNCEISMNGSAYLSWTTDVAEAASHGIIFTNVTPTDATNVLVHTAVSGASSYNAIYGNSIHGCDIGVAFVGYAAASPYTLRDTGNDTGGNSAATGNSIINFGGGGGGTVTIGIFYNYQQDINCSYNTINTNNGSGFNPIGSLMGVRFDYCENTDITCEHNSITLSRGNLLNHEITGIYTLAGSGTTSTISLSYNTIALSVPVGTTGNDAYGIRSSTTSKYLNINSNQIDISVSATSVDDCYGIYSLGNTITALNINTNTIDINLISSTTYQSAKAIYCTGGSVTCNTSISYNVFTGINNTLSTVYDLSCIYNTSSSLHLDIKYNNFDNLTFNCSGNIYLIYNNYTAPGYGTKDVSDNYTTGSITRTAGGSGSFYCYYGYGSSPSTITNTVQNNNFSNINTGVSNTGNVYGIYVNDHLPALTYPDMEVSGNTISGLTVGGGNFINAFYLSGFKGSSSAHNKVNGNTVSNITVTGNGLVKGLYIYNTN